MSKDSIRRALRTWLIATLALFIPGLLGWLHALTEWANGQGSTPFPDAHGLAYLGVSAISGGVIAVVNVVWNAIEDATGKGFLRTVPTNVVTPTPANVVVEATPAKPVAPAKKAPARKAAPVKRAGKNVDDGPLD